MHRVLPAYLAHERTIIATPRRHMKTKDKSLIKQHITQFLTYCEIERNFSDHTRKAYAIDLHQFNSFLKDSFPKLKIGSIDVTHIRAYLQQLQKNKPRTQRRKLAALKSFFGYLERETLLPKNPTKSMRLQIRIDKSLPRTVGVNSLKQLFGAVAKRKKVRKRVREQQIRDAALIELLFSTGMRVSEISNLRLETVDVENASLLVRGKGGKERTIPVCSTGAQEAMTKYAQWRGKCASDSPYFFTNRSGRRLSEQSIRIVLARLCKEAGIPKITPHALRHTVATMLLERGVDIRNIQVLLGHSSIVTTSIYVHVADTKQREILSRHHPRQMF